jgi:predicted HTH domain antitoxin
MQTLKIDLPDFVDVDKKELIMMLASKLYEEGKLSLGQGAALAGVTKRTFMELLGNYGVSVFNYNAKELKMDFENA